MLILDIILFLCVLGIAFYSGKKMADHYYQQILADLDLVNQDLQYQLRLSMMKASSQVIGYAPPPPRRRRIIGQPFIDTLKSRGRAIQIMRK